MKSPSDSVLALGKELAAFLDEGDMLGRWMSHHLAELIHAARESGDRSDSEAAAELILKIWRQRHTLGDRWPLHNFDAIFNTLENLEDRAAHGALSRRFGAGAPLETEQHVNALLRIATDLEGTLREILLWLFAQAAEEAHDRDAPWVALAIDAHETDESGALRRFFRTVHRSPQSGEDDEVADDAILGTLDRAITGLTELREIRESQVSGGGGAT